MFGALILLEVIVSVLLTLVILMQSSKGGGLAGTFGGGSVGMVFGVRRTADFLTKSTQVLAASFIILALVINIFFLPNKESGSQESAIQRGSTQQAAPLTPQLPPTQPPSSLPEGQPSR
jgi:preprotein translocase subunit SecG